MTGVSWFAAENGLPRAKAYQYLLMYKGIEFLERNYRYEQTLPREVIQFYTFLSPKMKPVED